MVIEDLTMGQKMYFDTDTGLKTFMVHAAGLNTTEKVAGENGITPNDDKFEVTVNGKKFLDMQCQMRALELIQIKEKERTRYKRNENDLGIH